MPAWTHESSISFDFHLLWVIKEKKNLTRIAFGFSTLLYKGYLDPRTKARKLRNGGKTRSGVLSMSRLEWGATEVCAGENCKVRKQYT